MNIREHEFYADKATKALESCSCGELAFNAERVLHHRLEAKKRAIILLEEALSNTNLLDLETIELPGIRPSVNRMLNLVLGNELEAADKARYTVKGETPTAHAINAVIAEAEYKLLLRLVHRTRLPMLRDC